MEALVGRPHDPRDLLLVGIEIGVGQRRLQHGTDLVLDALVLEVALVLEAVRDPEVGVLVGRDAEFLLEALLGGFLLGLALDGVGGDGAVPVRVPEALVGAALGEEDVAVLVEQQAGERAVADPLAGVRVESVDGPLRLVLVVDGDDVLARVGVVERRVDIATARGTYKTGGGDGSSAWRGENGET